MTNNELRDRVRPTATPNGSTRHHEEKKTYVEFTYRESPLTTLIQHSAHIRAIYHIFIVILILLLTETAVLDLVERGKINVGQYSVLYGFGDVKRGAKLWMYLLLVAIAFYILFQFYAIVGKTLSKKSGFRKIWVVIGIIGTLAVELALLVVPMWDLGKQHLALASSVTVTCEMFRFAMKILTITMDCGGRCFDDSTPLPTFKHYVYFLFAPTLLYRDEYPRTKKIRWGLVFSHFAEVAAIIFINSFLWERFILPYWSDYGKKPSVQAGEVIRGMFGCVFPGMLSFLCGFYCLLHAWLNAFAEMMTFGDRLFYEEWWTAGRFSDYFRLWNRVVHCWLRDHVYKPLAPHTGRAFATISVFFVSSLVHEMILALSFGFFYPVLFVQFGVMGLLMIPITSTMGNKFPKLVNIFMWFGFFSGNGMLWSLYPMEYFARKNCPPSEHDGFFVLKSWSCPEIIFNPDWTFQNPLNLFA